jgi:NAD+-dependent protein deacetylase sirtuin 4
MTDGGVGRLCELARGRAILALTGAGVSTESGIPDYRGPESLGRRRRPIHGPEFVRSESVRKRYWARSALGWDRIRAAQPNASHRALALLEHNGMVARVLTQNVDRLHHRAGSRKVIELHGALAEVACLECGEIEERQALQERIVTCNPYWVSQSVDLAPDGDAEIEGRRFETFQIPSCQRCGGILKPRVVFFGDNVPRATVEEAFAAVDDAEMVIIAGTSLAVYSGYRFFRHAVQRGIPVAIVNRGPVRGEEHAALRLEANTGATLRSLANALLGLGFDAPPWTHRARSDDGLLERGLELDAGCQRFA